MKKGTLVMDSIMIIVAAKGVEQPNLSLLCQSLMLSVTDYWAVQVGLSTPLTFARHRLSPLAAFASGAYFLHNGRR